MGDRCKALESTFERILDCPPDSRLILRLDGRAFHTFTKTGIARPFDKALATVMMATATAVLKEFNATLAYTQSDEITVVIVPTLDREGRTQLPFAGRLQKLITTAAAVATRSFVIAVQEFLPHKSMDVATFDARAFVCTAAEAEENLVWRQTDAMRNAVSNLYRSQFGSAGAKPGLDLGVHAMHAALVAAGGVDMTPHASQGIFLRRRERLCMLEPEILEKIPADRRPVGPVVRHEVVDTQWAPLCSMTNRAEVLWTDAEPILEPKEHP